MISLIFDAGRTPRGPVRDAAPGLSPSRGEMPVDRGHSSNGGTASTRRAERRHSNSSAA
jgi:hypothetical protein